MDEHDLHHLRATAAPVFGDLEEATWEEVVQGAQRLTLPAGTAVFGPGDPCHGLPMVLSGEIRVQMVGASGNEIVLYRIQGGELCPLSAACLLTGDSHQSEAVVEADSEVLLIPAALTERLMNDAAGFRRAVLASYGRRLRSLMLVIEEVAFRRLDQRLAERLLERQCDGQLAITHQALAVELGTAREVVSRLLKEFERRDMLGLERGRITIHKPAALVDMARAHTDAGNA